MIYFFVQFRSVQFSSIQFSSVQFSSVNLSEVNLDLRQFSRYRFVQSIYAYVCIYTLPIYVGVTNLATLDLTTSGLINYFITTGRY